MANRSSAGSVRLAALLLWILASGAAAQPKPGSVLSWKQVFDPGPSVFYYQNHFGSGVAALGDLNGDGIGDVAVGARGENYYWRTGAVWLFFLDSDGVALAHTKIAENQGGFTGDLQQDEQFGAALAALGDLDGNGVCDLAVGAPLDNGGGLARGAVWILFLGPEGIVQSQVELSATAGGLQGLLQDQDQFGGALAAVGDLDGDGIPELAVGPAPSSAIPGGAVWILFLARDGTVRDHVEIGAGLGGFTGALDVGDLFGVSLAALGDPDGDGRPDLAVGASGDDDAGHGRGALWILSLAPDGTVVVHRKIDAGKAGVDASQLGFGRSVSLAGDLGKDGLGDLAVGSAAYLHVLHLDADGHVKGSVAISGFGGGLTDGIGSLGVSVTSLGDLDGDGIPDLLCGGRYVPPFSKVSSGTLYVLHMNDGTLAVPQKIAKGLGGFDGALDIKDRFGSALALLDPLGGATGIELVVGAPGDDDGGTASDSGGGALWTLALDEGGQVQSYGKISATRGGFSGALGASDELGSAVASLGDLDGDGVGELAVGAPGDSGSPGSGRGAVWVLFRDRSGGVLHHQKIGHEVGGLVGFLSLEARFGSALASLGDLDGDGIVDLAVGAPGTGAVEGDGQVRILFLRADGSVRDEAIYFGSPTLPGTAVAGDRFGSALSRVQDLDGDGLPELAVGAPSDDDGGVDRGAVWLLFLRADGGVKAATRVSQSSGGFPGSLADGDGFGGAVAGLPDLDGDGLPELTVGAPGDDTGWDDHGAVWLLHLGPDGTVKERHRKLTNPGALPVYSGFPSFGDRFGSALAWLGDLGLGGPNRLAVGAPHDGGGTAAVGSLWLTCVEPCRWLDLGFGLAGSHGVPALVGQGALTPGKQVLLALDGALEAAPTAVVLGLAPFEQPFAGGLLVPRPDLLLTGLTTDASGSLSLSGRWPIDAPDNLALWAQFWIVDAGGPQGFAASNAVVGTAP